MSKPGNKILKFVLIFILNLIAYTTSFSQVTVGVTESSEESLDGYTFFSPFSSTNAYMVDNCGNLINQWNRGTRPGLSAYFLESGLMFRTYKVDPKGPFTSASNAGGLELVDWNNNTIWSYEINTPEWLSHHDAVIMPNGNILVLTWQLVYRDELVSLGRNPNQIAVENFMWSEKIIELEIVGSDDANIVWEWNIKDHYIQDFDDTKAGFGVISEHPELFDINLPKLNSSNSNASRDWNHFNAIDYNHELDQILLSVRNSDEIWILDHSTTTLEASTHKGGIYGKGGDILYRWGNASAYKSASINDQKLFGQHGVNWIDKDFEDGGKIMIYNNGNGRPGPDFSTVEIVSPPQSGPGVYLREQGQPYGPDFPEWIYGDQNGEEFYSPYLSNAKNLENGNILVNEGSSGIIFEINQDRNVVWEYIIPLNGNSPVSQGQNPISNGNFRAYKFDKNFVGFEGLDLMAGQPIELNPLECEQTSAYPHQELIGFKIYYDAYNHQLRIDQPAYNIKSISILDLHGRLIDSLKPKLFEQRWDIPYDLQGIYIIHVNFESGSYYNNKVFIK